MKKVTQKVLEKVLLVNPKAKKTTTWEQAWDILANEYDLEGSLEKTVKEGSKFVLFKNGVPEKEFTYTSGYEWNPNEGDWNWDVILHPVLDYCIAHKMLTKKKRTVKPKDKIVITEEPEVQAVTNEIPLKELKRKASNLSVRISSFKRKGKDYSELAKELASMRATIKQMKTK